MVHWFSRFKSRATPLFSSGDPWLFFELTGTHVHLTRMRVEPATRMCAPIDSFSEPLVDQSVAACAAAFAAVVARAPVAAAERIALMVDHQWGATRAIAVAITRSDYRTRITESELASLADRGLCRIMHEEQQALAQELGVAATAVRIIDASITAMRVDGKRMVSPVGFTGKSVECMYRITGIRSDLLEAISGVLTEDNLALVSESGMGIFFELMRRYGTMPSTYAYISERITHVYRAEEQEVQYADSFAWGSAAFLEGVAKYFSVALPVAKELLARYASGGVSQQVARELERAVAGEVAVVMQGIHAQDARNVPVFVYATQRLPRLLFNPAFLKRIRLSLAVQEVNDRILGQRGSFGVHYNEKMKEERDYALLLAACSEWYAGGQTDLVRRTLSKRIRWGRTTMHH